MTKKRMKESDMLAERIQLCESRSILARAKLSSIDRADLVTHLSVLSRHAVPLPFQLRCEALERQCDDILSDAIESEEVSERNKLLDKLIAKLVWVPGEDGAQIGGQDAGDSNLSVTWMLAELQEDLSTETLRGAVSREEALQTKKNAAEAGVLSEGSRGL